MWIGFVRVSLVWGEGGIDMGKSDERGYRSGGKGDKLSYYVMLEYISLIVEYC